MIRLCLYGCVYCNYGSLMLNLLSSLLKVYCTLSISLCYLCKTVLISLFSMLQRIDMNECRQ